MARINQDLIEHIGRKLGVQAKTVYRYIATVAGETMLDRHLAALVLAAQHGINVNKYSTPEERAAIRGSSGSGGDSRRHEPEGPATVGMGERPARQHRRSAKKAMLAKRTKGNTVFVVHGRDEPLRRSMFEFLRSINLNPLEWDHAIDEAREGNPYVGEVLDRVMQKAEAIVVLFSPDDLAQLKDHFVKPGERSSEGKAQGQPRPNVLFEAGLALGAYPDKTVMVQVGKVKTFSDIIGRHMMRLNDSTESRNSFINRLARKCQVNRIGNDWMRTGKFETTDVAQPKRKSRKR